MVSFTISISSEGLSTRFSSTYTASICSTHSNCSAPPPYQKQPPYRHGVRTKSSQNSIGSLENLLPRGSEIVRGGLKNRSTGKMAGNRNSEGDGVEGSMPIEMRRSFGRGGAGNIRRPSVVPYAVPTSEDGTRRRSSVWSTISISPGTSPEGRRATLMNLFGRKSSVSQAVEQDSAVKFKEVDLSGKQA